ncbi:MAG: histidine phosphatase family protein [Chlamydiales bacterium]|nr:histidine phosphatase family protein [Chlamydiales bacterium]
MTIFLAVFLKIKKWNPFLIMLSLILCGKLAALDNPKLVVVRHGEGEHNLLHIYSTWTKSEGGTDHCLTEKGRLQVIATAQRLLEQGFNKESVGLVLVSPLLRTCETAQILADCGVCSENMILIEERIREPLAKDWEGISTPPKQPDEDRWMAVVNASALHGGETAESIYQRIKSIITDISQWDPSRGHVILVTHGYPSRVLLEICGEQNINLDTAEARVLPFPFLE